MKVVVIGDVHGLSDWKDILNIHPDADKVVFLGDYVDSLDIPSEFQAQNLLDILEYKQQNKDKVVLLIGNHDFHYIDRAQKYTGFQENYFFTFNSIYSKAIEEGLLQMCYEFKEGNKKFLFTHAGVSEEWYRTNVLEEFIQERSVEENLNDLFKYTPRVFRFTMGRTLSQIGDDIEQTPIWIRPTSLSKNTLMGYHHVVGHTRVNNPQTFYFEEDSTSITFCDSLWNKYFVVIQDGGIRYQPLPRFSK